MTEKIVSSVCPTDHTTPAIFLINAISREAPRGDVLNHFNIVTKEGHKPEVDVELTINGVSVDFEKTVNEMWERLSNRFDEKVLEKAKELVSMSRFSKIEELIQDAEWKIEEELEKLFGDK